MHSCLNQQFCFISQLTSSQGKETIDPTKTCPFLTLFALFSGGAWQGEVNYLHSAGTTHLFLLLAEFPMAVVLWEKMIYVIYGNSWNAGVLLNLSPGGILLQGHCTKTCWKFLPEHLWVGGTDGVGAAGMGWMG